MASVMTNDKHAQSVFAHDTKQDCLWETMHQTAPNAFRAEIELSGTCEDSLNRCLNLGAKFVTEPCLLTVEIADRVV
jgi:hypothetical protein